MESAVADLTEGRLLTCIVPGRARTRGGFAGGVQAWFASSAPDSVGVGSLDGLHVFCRLLASDRRDSLWIFP